MLYADYEKKSLHGLTINGRFRCTEKDDVCLNIENLTQEKQIEELLRPVKRG